MLAALSIQEFAAKLASKESVPGGGAAAAVSGLLSVSLLEMVINLTSGRPAYAEYEHIFAAKRQELAQLHEELEQLIDRDATAFSKVMAALALPKATELECNTRTAAVQSALLQAAETPLAIAKSCIATLNIGQELLGKVNKQVVSDLAVGAVSSHAGVVSALLNTAVNLPMLKNKTAVDEMQTAIVSLRTTADALLRAIEDNVYADQTFAVMREA